MQNINCYSRIKVGRPSLFWTASCLLWCVGAAAPAQMAMPRVWNDKATGLSWALDNEQPLVDWWSARSFCDALTTYQKGWRQPTLGELIDLWQGSQFKPGFALGSGNNPLWTSEAEGLNVKVFIPRSTGAILGIMRRSEPNGFQIYRQNGIGVCVRKRSFWEVG
jgi:hypothetical protein